MKTVITISRQHGTNGQTAGKILAEKLGIPFYDNKILTDKYMAEQSEKIFKASEENKLPEGRYRNIASFYAKDTIHEELFDKQTALIKALADEGSAVFAGRCADFVLEDCEGLIKVFIYAHKDDRLARVMAETSLEADAAKAHIRKMDNSRSSYYNYHTDKKWGDRENYDLCIDCTGLTAAAVANIIKAYVDEKTK